MKKIIYALLALLLVVSGLVLANREIKSEPSQQTNHQQLTSAEIKKKWEATPDGLMFNQWKASSEGQRVLAAEAKIRNHIKDSTNLEAVVTSLSLPSGARLGFGVMVTINDEVYILSFGSEKSNEFQLLHSMKVNDKIIIRSHAVSHAPKYSYPILSGNYVEHDGKILYKRAPRQDGC